MVLGSYTKKQVRGALHFFLCSNSVDEKSVVTLGNFLKGQKKRGGRGGNKNPTVVEKLEVNIPLN